MRATAAVLGLALALAFVPAETRAADPVSATSTIDRSAITIGDPVLFSVVVEAASGWQVIDPGVARSLGTFDVIETEPALQSRLAGGVTRLTFRYRISAYRVGQHAVPALEVAYSGPDGATGVARTAAHFVTVASVILAAEETSDIKPLKPQLALPGVLASELLRWAVLAAAAAVLLVVAVLAWLLLRRRRGATADRRTPAERALEELEGIAALGLADKGRYAEHYERMGEVLRRYIAEQYHLPAGERTPRELRGEMERAGIDPQQRSTIYELLREGEVVRFHRAVSHPAHARNALGSALGAMKRAAAAEQHALAAVRTEA
ncbi:hypothetical protein BH18CHL2_BH18CHL2_10870 [soil metagenome]